MGTEYFMSLQGLHTFDAIVDEIYEQVTHVEPWATGTQRVPSSAFCLLVKLCTFRVTREQMKVLLTHGDSPHIRAMGFLYLRRAPRRVWRGHTTCVRCDVPSARRRRRGAGGEGNVRRGVGGHFPVCVVAFQ